MPARISRSAVWAAAIVALTACGTAAPSRPPNTQSETQRPYELDRWPTLGVTVRSDGPGAALQIRQIQISPEGFDALLANGAYADGTVLTARFFETEADSTKSPPLYWPTEESAFAMEVIDRTHPDGRRFYSFAAGDTTATPMPPGNTCAVCHATQGAFDATFAQFYPGLADITQTPSDIPRPTGATTSTPGLSQSLPPSAFIAQHAGRGHR